MNYGSIIANVGFWEGSAIRNFIPRKICVIWLRNEVVMDNDRDAFSMEQKVKGYLESQCLWTH